MDHHLEDTSNTDHNRSEKALPPISARSLPPLSPFPVLGQPRQTPPHPFCVVPQGQPPPWVYLQMQCKELPLGGASARCRLTSDHTQLTALRMLTRVWLSSGQLSCLTLPGPGIGHILETQAFCLKSGR